MSADEYLWRSPLILKLKVNNILIKAQNKKLQRERVVLLSNYSTVEAKTHPVVGYFFLNDFCIRNTYLFMQKARFTWKILNLQLTKKTEINPYTIKLALPRKKIKIITYIKINQRKIHLIKSKSKINITFSVIIVCKDFPASFLRHPT